MRFSIFSLTYLTLSLVTSSCLAQSTEGIKDLVRRRLPNHVDDFSFELVNDTTATVSTTTTANSSISPRNDYYTVFGGLNGTIHIEGNTPIALASGLRWYLSNVAHVDIYWFVGSRLHLAPSPLPRLDGTYLGRSVVPWRYHFNTVTFSYTAAFWTWEDWELQLDWMALRGVNLSLAWVGQERILMDVFTDAGFTQSEVLSFLSGPAFQAWNRFGNIQGSWGKGGETLPISWINGQFELQKKIVKRMVELGMMPVLPCFTGFVPRAVERVWPDATVVNGSRWNGFPSSLTNVTFLEPMDSRFAELQKSFVEKQKSAYGNVTNVYTLDQYNENDPFSGDLEYLRNVTRGTWQSLKSADASAIWLMQGWLFYSNSAFWTDQRIEAYLSGVETDSDMLILDLFSESAPQWQRTNSYFGKPWIWCQLHDYGGNMGLYGQVENVTINPIEALANSSSLVGFGLTPEGQEGNEIIYDILLDQAWSTTPIDSKRYFSDWVTSRYFSSSSSSSNSTKTSIPGSVYAAWDILRTTVYNNTNFNLSLAVTKSVFELSPNTTGLANKTIFHATVTTYDPKDLQRAWSLLYNATRTNPSLLKYEENPAFVLDFVDVTRQVMANAFTPLYTLFIESANSTVNATFSPARARETGEDMLALLTDLDRVLLASGIMTFSLWEWIDSARDWAGAGVDNQTNVTHAANADLYEYNARNQITLWGPEGEINDYASKQWGGLVGEYYLPRWRLFVEFTLNSTTSSEGDNEGLREALLAFEEGWQEQRKGVNEGSDDGEGLEKVLESVMGRWKGLFSG